MTVSSAVHTTSRHERDNCQVCLGLRGGVPGNENRWQGIVICDYCTVRLPTVPVGHVSASDVAMHQFALAQQLLILRRELSNSPISAEAEHILRQMSCFLNTLHALPVQPMTLPWTSVTESLPQPLDQIFAMTVDGQVKDTSGAMLLPEPSVPGHAPALSYTHWTLKPGTTGASLENQHG